MGVRKTFTRDEMRAFLTILKEQLDVEYSTKNLSNVEKCKAAIKDIVNIYIQIEYVMQIHAVSIHLL